MGVGDKLSVLHYSPSVWTWANHPKFLNLHFPSPPKKQLFTGKQLLIPVTREAETEGSQLKVSLGKS
jgi:hypothetical protein